MVSDEELETLWCLCENPNERTRAANSNVIRRLISDFRTLRDEHREALLALEAEQTFQEHVSHCRECRQARLCEAGDFMADTARDRARAIHAAHKKEADMNGLRSQDARGGAREPRSDR